MCKSEIQGRGLLYGIKLGIISTGVIFKVRGLSKITWRGRLARKKEREVHRLGSGIL